MYAWDGHKYGCEDDFNEEEPCIVYTFGVGREISFEEDMATRGKTVNLTVLIGQRVEHVNIFKDVRCMHMTTQSRISHLQSTTISTLQRLELVHQTA